jgi:hypothetical protein
VEPHPQATTIVFDRRFPSMAGSGGRGVWWALRFMAVVAGALQSFALRHSMNPDGVSYLDIAELYASGQWSEAVNGYWSPLYSWIMAPLYVRGGPAMHLEFPAVHAVHFLIYLLALFAFDFFLRESLARRTPGNSTEVHAEWPWAVLGYGFFLWSTLYMIGLGVITPDLLVATLVFLVAGMIIRLQRVPHSRPGWFAGIGLVLGLGTLAKTIFLPFGILVLACLVVMLALRRTSMAPAALAGFTFVLVAGPWIGTLSTSKGRLTFGDNGRVVHAWFVGDVKLFRHWQGGDGTGTPISPTRQIFDAPRVFEFGSPLPGTYPVWFEPSHWYAGVEVSPPLRKQLAVVFQNLLLQLQTLLPLLPAAVLLILLNRQHLGGALLGNWPVIFPSLAVLGAYSLVFVQTRYTAPFIAVIALSLLVTLVPVAGGHRGLPSRWSFAALLLLAAVPLSMGARAVGEALTHKGPEASRSFEEDLELVRQLESRGIGSGSRIAIVGNDFHLSWARLGRVAITVEIPRGESHGFWSLPDERRREVLELMSGGDRHAVLARSLPGEADPEGWEPLGPTGVHLWTGGGSEHGYADSRTPVPPQ